MKIERHESGPRMRKAVIHGDTVYLACIVADNPKGKSTAEQTRSILSLIDDFWPLPGPTRLSPFPPISGLPTWRSRQSIAEHPRGGRQRDQADDGERP